MTEAGLTALIDQMASQLGEHFDAVQIMASGNEEGVTCCIKRGVGNWYARQGMAHEFINADMAQENARQISDALTNDPPDPDSEDAWKQG